MVIIVIVCLLYANIDFRILLYMQKNAKNFNFMRSGEQKSVAIVLREFMDDYQSIGTIKECFRGLIDKEGREKQQEIVFELLELLEAKNKPLSYWIKLIGILLLFFQNKTQGVINMIKFHHSISKRTGNFLNEENCNAISQGVEVSTNQSKSEINNKKEKLGYSIFEVLLEYLVRVTQCFYFFQFEFTIEERLEFLRVLLGIQKECYLFGSYGVNKNLQGKEIEEVWTIFLQEMQVHYSYCEQQFLKWQQVGTTLDDTTFMQEYKRYQKFIEVYKKLKKIKHLKMEELSKEHNKNMELRFNSLSAINLEAINFEPKTISPSIHHPICITTPSIHKTLESKNYQQIMSTMLKEYGIHSNNKSPSTTNKKYYDNQQQCIITKLTPTTTNKNLDSKKENSYPNTNNPYTTKNATSNNKNINKWFC